MNRATSGVMIAIRQEERRGRIMVQGMEELEDPSPGFLAATNRAGSTDARASPTTSSMTAALIKIVPMRLYCKELLRCISDAEVNAQHKSLIW